jgi:hypothetical protein
VNPAEDHRSFVSFFGTALYQVGNIRMQCIGHELSLSTLIIAIIAIET